MIPDKTKTVILIPTYNEVKNLVRLITRISEQSLNLDILIIDDNSPDGTAELAQELSKTHPWVHMLRRKCKEGLGRAYLDGFRWALERGYDIFIQMDADLSHDPSALPKFTEAIKDYHAVFGSRYLRGVRVMNWSFKRLLLSKLANEFTRIVLNLPTTDTTTAFKCFRREVIEAIGLENLHGKTNAFLIEIVFKTIRHGFKTTEIPFMFIERDNGESKMNFKVAAECLFMVFKLRLLGK